MTTEENSRVTKNGVYVIRFHCANHSAEVGLLSGLEFMRF